MLDTNRFEIDAAPELMKLANFDAFMKKLEKTLGDVAEKIPSDGLLQATVVPLGRGYKVAVRVVSDALKFYEKEEGNSPYVALDKVVMNIESILRMWNKKRVLFH